MKLNFFRIVLILSAVLMPIFLILTSVRLLITPLYPMVEYHMPWFPDDPYGLSLEERLHYSRFAIDYLNNNEDISWLGNLTFADGSAFYAERELDHMVDVKELVQVSMRWWLALLVSYFAIWFYSLRAGLREDRRAAWAAGGRWTIAFLVVVLVGVALSFNWLFTLFHSLFFDPGTWLFLYSDSLIRLFPLVFWRDAFILMGIVTIALAGFLIWDGRGTRSGVDNENQSKEF